MARSRQTSFRPIPKYVRRKKFLVDLILGVLSSTKTFIIMPELSVFFMRLSSTSFKRQTVEPELLNSLQRYALALTFVGSNSLQYLWIMVCKYVVPKGSVAMLTSRQSKIRISVPHKKDLRSSILF